MECLNFMEECYAQVDLPKRVPAASIYAGLPTELIMRIIKEGDGGRTAHANKFKAINSYLSKGVEPWADYVASGQHAFAEEWLEHMDGSLNSNQMFQDDVLSFANSMFTLNSWDCGSR